MSVPNTYTPAQYNCNGSTVAFPFTFGVGATSEIEVILTDANKVETILTETTHYTVSAANNDYESGGTVMTVATYASGNKITIRINVPLTQDADFVEGAPTLYESFENGLDKLTRIAQQLSEGRERTLIVPKTELASISREIPDAATRANKLLGFDASGEPVAVVDVEGITLTTFGNALVSSDDAAEARTILEAVLDEDDFASNSTDQAPSQQSALAYFMAKTGANLAIGSDADGDMWYRAAGAMARLAKGPANTKLFMNAAGTGPEWTKGAKVGSFQFNLSGASGVQLISGVGFKPSHGIFITGMNSTVNVSFGIDNGTDHFVACAYYEAGDGWYFGNAGSMMVYTGAGGINKLGHVSEWIADGFKVTWTRNGETPDLVADVFYMVWR